VLPGPRSALTAAVILLSLTGCTSGTKKVTPAPSSTITGVHVYTDLSHRHLQKGEYDISYPQSPPVGGAHSPVWLKCQVYDTELPKVNTVHSLEHGGISVTYLPSLPAAQLATLDQLVGLNREFVMVSPYAGQASPIVVTAWGMQLDVQTSDDPRIVEFIRTYAGGDQGGEKGVGCASTGASLPQALSYDAQNQ
jgi:hypothetical protein